MWSHEFIFPTVREQMEPVLELVRGYLTTDYDFPTAIEAMRRDIEAASREILDGLTGEALEEMQAANAVNLRMAPLTPDHHFYIDQGANAHLRLVLLEVGRHLVEDGRLDQPDDVLFLRYNEMRALIGSADALDARAIVAERRSERDAAARIHPRDWVGTVTPSQLAFPYLVNWGYPDRFHQTQSDDQRQITGLGASPGVIEGIARVVRTVDEFDDVRDGDILVCQMTNPAWVVLFTKIAGLVTDTGGTTSHPAVLAREFGIPAVIGTSVATHRIATGDRVRVDGTAGKVEILVDAPRRRPTRDCAGRRDRALTGAVDGGRAAHPAHRPGRPGQGPPARGHPERLLPARLADRRDPGRPRARHEPGAGARGAPRSRGARARRDHAVPRGPRPAPVAARDHRGVRRPLGARGARRLAGRRPR